MFYATITGNLGRDAENRTTKSGKNVASLSLGTTPRIKVNGEFTDGETIWITVTVWDHLPEMLFCKGQLVMVTGQVKQTSYEKDGVEKQRLEITADNIGVVHRVKREAAPANDIWGSSSSDGSVIAKEVSDLQQLVQSSLSDDLPF